MSPGNRHTDGVLGTPSPYAVSNDNTVTALLWDACDGNDSVFGIEKLHP